MRRNTFVLSWGRKIFFGLGWLLISLLALNYLQDQFPESSLGWTYFLSTYIGHFGLMTAILYFVFYVPVVGLMPSYYIARFWSLILVLAAGLYILFDSVIFNQYRYHLNGFIFDLLGSDKNALNFSFITYMILGIGIIVFSLIFWLRGERTWRVMQGRFSNPNKNWYLVLILLSLITSHALHIYGKATGAKNITSIAKIFPLHFPATANEFLSSHGFFSNKTGNGKNSAGDFYYPRKSMECIGDNNKNILMIVIDGWESDELSPYVTPTISHISTHSSTFTNHFSTSTKKKESLFSLFYSLPANYWGQVYDSKKSPVLMDEMIKQQYSFGVFSSSSLSDLNVDKTIFSRIQDLKFNTIQGDPVSRDNEMVQTWKSWLKGHLETKKESPFFGYLFFEPDLKQGQSPDDHKIAINNIDSLISEVMKDLYLNNLNSDTIVMIMGDYSTNPHGKVPMIIYWPEMPPASVEKMTSHYDIVPTLMQELWRCKNKLETYSFGQNLFSDESRDWLLVSDNKEYDILDFRKNLITKINPSGSYQVLDFNLQERPKVEAREDLIFHVLKDVVRFNKKR